MAKKDRYGIGVYGGSFDPIHFAHLQLACTLYEEFSLRKVYFIPAKQSPHKKNKCRVSDSHRLEILKIALKNYPNFKVLDIELVRQAPSYTIDTLKILKESEKEPLYLMMGMDNFQSLGQWKDINEILECATPIIAARQSNKPHPIDPTFKEIYQKGFRQTPLMDISSTMLRKRIKQGLPSYHLCPEKVLDYIFEHQLYSSA